MKMLRGCIEIQCQVPIRSCRPEEKSLDEGPDLSETTGLTLFGIPAEKPLSIETRTTHKLILMCY